MSRAPSARDRLAFGIFFRHNNIIAHEPTRICEGANGRRNRITLAHRTRTLSYASRFYYYYYYYY